MKCYKGFDKDLKCREFQYEIGKTYETDKADICKEGFHACENPIDVLRYYSPSDSRFCEVELDVNEQKENDSKRVGKKIQIGAEIGLDGLIQAGIKFVFEKAEFNDSDGGNAVSNGAKGIAVSNGDGGNAVSSGDEGNAVSNGRWGNAVSSGDKGNAVSNGYEGIAIVTGRNSKAKGALGCWLVLTERDSAYNIVDMKAVKVDGEKIKTDTFYKLKNGEVVEA